MPERADALRGRRVQISLDVRNENLPEKRIHQICAWKLSPLPVGERLVARAGYWKRLWELLALRITLFFSVRRRRQPSRQFQARLKVADGAQDIGDTRKSD